MTKIIECLDVDSPDVHKKLVLKGAKLILQLQEDILKKMQKEQPEIPGVSWDNLFYMIDRLKNKEPKFVFAESLEEAEKMMK